MNNAVLKQIGETRRAYSEFDVDVNPTLTDLAKTACLAYSNDTGIIGAYRLKLRIGLPPSPRQTAQVLNVFRAKWLAQTTCARKPAPSQRRPRIRTRRPTATPEAAACVHHWVLEEAREGRATVASQCKHCGNTKAFSVSMRQDSYDEEESN